jgi:hypothetical protein
MKNLGKSQNLLTIAVAAATFAAGAIGTTPASAQSQPTVVQWLANACMASGGNAAQCSCYAQVMLSNASPYDQSEMLQGRVTSNMEAVDPRAKAQCGIQAR